MLFFEGTSRRGWRSIAVAALAGVLMHRLTGVGEGRALGGAQVEKSEGEIVALIDDYESRKANQQAVRRVVEKIRPSVVHIETVGGASPSGSRASTVEAAGDGSEPAPERKRHQRPFEDNPGSDFDVADGPTTGIVYSADGYIVTSSFNFVREPTLISVRLADGRRLAADLIARDAVRKIALLKVEASELPVAPWAQVEDVRVGQTAIAIGLGFGAEQASVTVGIVSALNRMQGNAIQTDAKLSPANYGGPVCDIRGRVLGLAVPMAQRPGELAGVEMYDSGVGFAVPRHRVDEIVETLKTGQSFYRGWLGMSVDPKSKDSVVIRNVADPSPMREAGVQPGDQLLSIDEKSVKHFGQLVQALYMRPAGEPVYLHLSRRGLEYGVKVRLARSVELGELPEVEEPFDPANPFPKLPRSEEREFP